MNCVQVVSLASDIPSQSKFAIPPLTANQTERMKKGNEKVYLLPLANNISNKEIHVMNK